MKRVFDFSLALIGITVSFPLWLLLIFLIWLEDGRPVFYIQDRLGLNEKKFKLIKFRTMDSGDKRVSKFANFLRKTALDELPQLINILRSEMSFVGPRPIAVEEFVAGEDVRARLKLKPGLTGIAQILLPKDVPLQEKTKYDIWYAQNRSLKLDIGLILRSFWISLGRKWDKNNKSYKAHAD